MKIFSLKSADYESVNIYRMLYVAVIDRNAVVGFGAV
jgi:hypothetical protein